MQEHDPREGGPRPQVVAAAEAVRAWIHAQRGREATPLQRQSQPAIASTLPEGRSRDLPDDRTPEDSSYGRTPEDLPDTIPEPTEPESPGPVLIPALVRWSWRLGLAAALIALVAMGGGRAWTYARDTWLKPAAAPRAEATAAASLAPAAPKAPSASTRTGSLSVQSDPTGARIVLDGSDRGAAPMTIAGLTVGTHALVLQSDKGSVRRTLSIAANETTEVNESIFGGWLHVSTPLEIDISEGAKGFQLDAKNEILLDAGTHDVQFQNRALGYREVRHVEIKPGWTTAITLAPRSTLSVTSTEPAEVFVDGARAGETPLSNFAVALGTRDVKVRGAGGDERAFTVPVTVMPVRLDVDFSKR